MGGKRLVIGEFSGELELLAIGERSASRKLIGTFEITCLCHRCGETVAMHSTEFRQRKMCRTCSGVRGANLRTTHGGARRGKTDPLYLAWKQMHTRCENPASDAYFWYGAKGISVCAEWADFVTFRSWAHANGYSKGMSLDRKDPTKDYSPANCEYVTKSENSRRARAAYEFVPKRTGYPLYDEPWFGEF